MQARKAPSSISDTGTLKGKEFAISKKIIAY
jgi:hypothetical protein